MGAGQKIIAGLKEALEWSRGETRLRCTFVKDDGEHITRHLTVDEQKAMDRALRRGTTPLYAVASPTQKDNSDAG